MLATCESARPLCCALRDGFRAPGYVPDEAREEQCVEEMSVPLQQPQPPLWGEDGGLNQPGAALQTRGVPD
jgi:hypothetical protein